MNIKEVKMLILIPAIAIFLVLISADMANASLANQNDFPYSTPLQDAIKKSVSSGKISQSDIAGEPKYNFEILEKNDTHIKLKATTEITFKNPKAAGYADNKWPKMEIKKNLSLAGNGTVIPGVYDQQIKDYITSKIQTIPEASEKNKKLEEWNNYDYEHGPRTIIFDEIFEVTYPENLSNNLAISDNKKISNDILLGFTKTKNVRWIVESRWNLFGSIVYWFKVGLEFDAALGLRLPMSVNLNVPKDLFDGQKYMLSSSIKGINWDANQYSAANVPTEDGNEFVARLKFFIGIRVVILNIPVINWYLETDKNYGKNFKTPFGPNEEFPIQDLVLSPTDTGLNYCWIGVACLGIGLKIDPNLGSESISTNWNTRGDIIGNGLIRYEIPENDYSFGPILAIDYDDSTDYANIKLSDFKYYFNRCNIDVSANVAFSGILSFFPDAPYIRIYNIGCNDITGSLYLGTHVGTNADSLESRTIVKRNMLSVPGFENPWIFYTNGIGTFSNDAPGQDSPSSGYIKISKNGTNVQLYQAGLRLRPNTKYSLTFKAFSNRNNKLAVSIIKHRSPYTNYGLSNKIVELEKSWKEYTIYFTTSGFSVIADDARLMFWLAPYAHKGDQYYIDDVVLSVTD